MPDPEAREALIAALLGEPAEDESGWPLWSGLTRRDLPEVRGPVRTELDKARADMVDLLRQRLPDDGTTVGDKFTFLDLAYIAAIAVYGVEPNRRRVARLTQPPIALPRHRSLEELADRIAEHRRIEDELIAELLEAARGGVLGEH